MHEPQEVHYGESCVRDVATGQLRPSIPFSTNSPTLLYKHSGVKQFMNATALGTNQNDLVHDKGSLNHIIKNEKFFCSNQSAVVRLVTDEGYGSAFFVSPTILCTTRHCTAAQRESGTPMTICTSIQSSKGVDDVDHFLVTALVPDQDWYNFHHKTPRVFDIDPSVSSTSRELNYQCDVDFLLVQGYTHKGNYFTPMSTVHERDPIAVMGYPGVPNSTWLNDFGMKITAVSTAFCHFDQRAISPGNILAINERVLCHTASTLPGNSGGPIIPLEDSQKLLFCGIHTECWKGLTYNFGVSVTHPYFVKMYQQYVVPTLQQQ